MASGSLSLTGRLDEQLAELREIVGALKDSTTPSQTLRKVALATLEALPSGKPSDTVHLSVNVGEDGAGNRTYTVTVSHTPDRSTK